MTKSIKIQVLEDGQKYFTIYAVKAVKHEGKVIVYDTFLKKSDAEEAVEFVERVHKRLYRSAFIREQIVWC